MSLRMEALERIAATYLPTALKTETAVRVLGVLVAVYSLFRFLKLTVFGKSSYNLPPGPSGLPIVGYLPFLTKTPHAKFDKLRKKYGNAFSLYLGRQLVVVLGDVEYLRETYGKDEYHGRAPENLLCPGVFRKNISAVNGKDWMEQRKLFIHGIKAVGRGNEFVESIIQQEVERFIKYVKQTNGSPIDMKPITSTCVSNVISNLAWSKSYEIEDETRQFMDAFVQDMVEHADMTACQNFFPWMKWTPVINKYGGWDNYIEKTKKLRAIFEKLVDEHQKTLDKNNPRDFIDAELIQSDKSPSCDHEILIGSLMTFLAAGGETVRTSLHWAFLVLVENPEIQAKIQKEVDMVVGHDRKPAWSDQNNMPYTMSVLMEVQRHYTIVPLNVNRYTVADTTVGQYDVPKGTFVISNLWNVLHDPNYWNEPETFLPERFLDDTKEEITKPKSYLPFSFGKRICPGENLSMMEMFLFLTSALQEFNLKLPHGGKIDLTPEYFATTQPQDQTICMLPRTVRS